jgi:hypothetical protein
MIRRRTKLMIGNEESGYADVPISLKNQRLPASGLGILISPSSLASTSALFGGSRNLPPVQAPVMGRSTPGRSTPGQFGAIEGIGTFNHKTRPQRSERSFRRPARDPGPSNRPGRMPQILRHWSSSYHTTMQVVPCARARRCADDEKSSQGWMRHRRWAYIRPRSSALTSLAVARREPGLAKSALTPRIMTSQVG